MFEHSEAGVIMAAVLDTRRANKDGFYPVKIRVTYRRERKYYGTGKFLSEEGWARLPEIKRRVGESKALFDVKDDIQVVADKVKENIKELIRADQFSFDTLNKRLGNTTSATVNGFFISKITSLQEGGKVSSCEMYKDTLRSMILFEYAATDKATIKGSKIMEVAPLPSVKILFSQITPTWLKRYEKHMIDEGKSYTTISMYMRGLKTILNEAKTAGIIKVSQFPFGGENYSIPQHEGRNIALTISDISKLVKYECATNTLAMCRDLWFFSYLCNGANITDICKLKYANIRNGDICFYRQKTINKTKKKKLIQAIITPEMQSIITRWGTPAGKPDDFIFPFLKGDESPADERRIIKNITKLMNDKMKVIGASLGIGNISTYTARHSYASVLKRSGANIAFISESLGHSDLKMTENYLASFEQEERQKNAALLTNF